MSSLKDAQLDNSDSDDPDFDPDFEAAVDADGGSSSDSDDCAGKKEEDEDEDEEVSEEKTSKTSKSKSRGRRKKNTKKEEVKEELKNDKIEENNEDTSKKAESLWASFKSDVSSSEKSKNGAITEDKFKKTELSSSESTLNKPSASNKKIEKISPSQSTGGAKRPGGLSSILSQLGKKPKVGILESSKLEWNKFKKEENIEEELSQINRGKKGYLEKQDFLQRTDLRQFEIEKKLRSINRRSLN